VKTLLAGPQPYQPYEAEVTNSPISNIRDFDDAIQSRITLAVRYEPLSLPSRKQVWASFLKKTVTVNGTAKYNAEDLDGLARKNLIGRQVRAPFFNPVESVNTDRVRSS
jgi:hypothetical protein